KKQGISDLELTQGKAETLLSDLSQRISEYYRRVAARTKTILDVRDNIAQLQSLLTGEHERHVTAISSAIQEFDEAVSSFVEAGKLLRAAVGDAKALVHEPVST